MTKKKISFLTNVCGREGCGVAIAKNKRYCRGCLIERFRVKSELEKKYTNPAKISQELRAMGYTMELCKSYLKATKREDDTWD